MVFVFSYFESLEPRQSFVSCVSTASVYDTKREVQRTVFPSRHYESNLLYSVCFFFFIPRVAITEDRTNVTLITLTLRLNSILTLRFTNFNELLFN